MLCRIASNILNTKVRGPRGPAPSWPVPAAWRCPPWGAPFPLWPAGHSSLLLGLATGKGSAQNPTNEYSRLRTFPSSLGLAHADQANPAQGGSLCLYWESGTSASLLPLSSAWKTPLFVSPNCLSSLERLRWSCQLEGIPTSRMDFSGCCLCFWPFLAHWCGCFSQGREACHVCSWLRSPACCQLHGDRSVTEY